MQLRALFHPRWLLTALGCIALGGLPDPLAAQGQQSWPTGPAPESRISIAPYPRVRVAWQQPLPPIGAQSAESPGAAAGDPQYQIPLSGTEGRSVEMRQQGGLISLVVREAPLQEVLTALAESQQLNLVTVGNVEATITTTLEGVRWEDALDSILAAAGYTWFRKNGIIHVASLADSTTLSPELQGRQVEVFQLDYAAADDVNGVIAGMLSPAGQSSIITSEATDNRRTREVLVVEDMPDYLHRIRHQVAVLDQPPRQVMIEAHVLEVELSDDCRHGVNLDHLFNLSGNLVQIQATGLANSNASPAFFVDVSGGNLDSVLELLKSTTDAKTLASPRILCLNGQTARIQVGEQLGFRITTTTETSTTESIEFLDVGVVLRVTPRISRDGRVMMRIQPEVSSGRVSVAGLPEEETTELETDVLVQDNQAVVIGGLIQEADREVQSKVPFLGDLHLIGRLFQRREVGKLRSEIIIALLPRVVPYDPLYQQQEEVDVARTQAPLLQGPLERFPRPWEPALRDAIHQPICIRLPAITPHPDDCSGCSSCTGSKDAAAMNPPMPSEPFHRVNALEPLWPAQPNAVPPPRTHYLRVPAAAP